MRAVHTVRLHEPVKAVLVVLSVWVGDGPVLRFVQVNRGVREVRKTPGVVPMQVSQHDVSYARGRESKPCHLPYGGLLGIQYRFGECQEVISEGIVRTLDVGQPEPGVDEDEAVRVGLDQQAVTDSPFGRR